MFISYDEHMSITDIKSFDNSTIQPSVVYTNNSGIANYLNSCGHNIMPTVAMSSKTIATGTSAGFLFNGPAPTSSIGHTA